MTTDIARTDESSLDVLPPAQPMSSNALAVLREHSHAMDIAYQYAKAVCGTQVCPARFRGKPEDGAAAILYGLEIGLSPSAALQKVVVIHGMPSLEARTMVGLLKPRGYKVRTLEQTDEKVTVEGVDPDGDRYVSTWTIERARKAGYVPEIDERTGKYKTNSNGKLIGNEKYLTDPQAMLKAKAQAEVCRDMAPDALLGITYSREDLESERWDDPQPSRVERPRSTTTTVDEIFSAPAAAEPQDVEEVESDDLPADDGAAPEPEPGQGGGNDQSQGATPSSGADSIGQADSGDQAPAAEPATPEDKPKSARRKAAEKRVFTLIGDIKPPVDRDDRITIYRLILERDEITSTDDLSDADLKKVGDKLYAWSDDGNLDSAIRDLLNAADLRAAAIEDGQQ